jgi:hypothetical protein
MGVCNCEDFKRNRGFWDKCMRLHGLRGYSGMPLQEVLCSVDFRYCPWCGKELTDERVSGKDKNG